MSFADDEFDDYDDSPRGNVEPHRGVLILVLGILGLMVCGILGIFAWLMGKSDLEKMRLGRMDKEGESMTKVGYILGIVASIFLIIGILFTVLYIVGVAVFLAGK